ncbi:MAG: phosphatase domain-containing protein [Catalinimonas sp.]
MARWKRPIKRVGRYVRAPLRQLKINLKQELGWLEQPLIQPYRTFGTADRFRVLGRVVEDSGLVRTKRHNSGAQNVLAMVKRFASDQIPGVCVRARLHDRTYTAQTDERGFFEFEFAAPEALNPDTAWHGVELQLIDEVIEAQRPAEARAEVLVPPASARFGVISDVDDTILISRATQTVRKVLLMLLGNARTRAPFEGVAAFYRALHAGAGGRERNPIFYVSSSEWNLYDLLADFCAYRNIPKGPFMLRAWEIDWRRPWRSGGSHDHKHHKIRRVLSTYPDLPFILIGDSGQHDAEIYAETVRRYPGRIKAIYIRDVSRPQRDQAIMRIANRLRTHGVEMLLVSDTEAAARHAADRGWIDPAALQHVVEDRRADQQAPTEVERVFGTE